MASTLDDLQAECDAMRGYNPEWYVKMMHKIPPARVVDRIVYVLTQCEKKRVLHLGCNWPPGYLHKAIAKVATRLYGVDICVPPGPREGLFGRANLDKDNEAEDLVGSLHVEKIELIVCAEILEHLGNPGNLLARLRQLSCPVLITVPNAFNTAGYYHITGGVESVNPEHVAYYSYHTLKVLVERYGYIVKDWCWYNGKPGTAEGLIFLVQ